MFKHVTLAFGFDEPLNELQLTNFLNELKALASQDQPLVYFRLDEVSPHLKDAYKE